MKEGASALKEQLVKGTTKIYDGTNSCTSITIHETSNTDRGADAQAHADLQSSGNVRQASWHVQVDDTEAIRSYPDTAQCWHGGTREANESSLAVEICVNSAGDYDEAFKNAAEVVRDWRIKHNIPRHKVFDHAHWTGKNCPSKLRASGRWEEFLDLTEPGTKPATKKEKSTVTKFSSPLPVGTYRTDAFDGIGRGRQHMGCDWAGPKVGDMTPVYAVADAVVEETGGPSRGDVLAGHSGYIVVLDHGILKDSRGADRIRTNYGHLSRILVKEGQHVKAGQQIGVTGRSGNVTGVHLHMGVRENGKGYGSYFDPEEWLKRKGITVGKTAPLVAGSAPQDKPASKPKPKAKPSEHKNSKADNQAIQLALTTMGIDVGYADGVDGPKQKAGVRAFQKHHGLVVDEYWGPVTQEVYEYNKRLQRALNSMKHSAGITDVKVDGWIGNATNRLKRDVLKRNKWTEKNLISNLKKVGAW